MLNSKKKREASQVRICCLLLQSATCGIVACIRLGPPLPLDWSPWKDISQGQEVFKIPALNPVDDTPPPTDFACVCLPLSICLFASSFLLPSARRAAIGECVWVRTRSYQTRNVLFSRLPRSSTLCLCRGCIPPGVDTSDWEKV